ncbi:MAG: FtsB family cell division protein [Alcanivoracaceae bacterium]
MAMSPRRQVVLALVALALLGLQARLWFGEGSLRHVSGLKETVATKQAENQLLFERNRLMSADVDDLKSGLDAVEEIARRDLGMVRDGETFFLMIDDTGEAHGTAR